MTFFDWVMALMFWVAVPHAFTCTWFAEGSVIPPKSYDEWLAIALFDVLLWPFFVIVALVDIDISRKNNHAPL